MIWRMVSIELDPFLEQIASNEASTENVAVMPKASIDARVASGYQ